MKVKTIVQVVGVFCLGATLVGCSRESRNEAIDRVGRAAKELSGETVDNTKKHATPTIVAEQQKRERVRQNTEWTPENQAAHPIEFCQAKLEELAGLAKKQETNVFTYRRMKVELSRRQTDAQAVIDKLKKGLADCKAAYKAADAAGKWPMTFNGYKLEKEAAQSRIVEMARRVKREQDAIAAIPAQLARVERKIDELTKGQERIETLRERLQTTITDLKTKQVLDGEKGIKDALTAINDSLDALAGGTEAAVPSVDELLAPSKAQETAAEFNAIMAE